MAIPPTLPNGYQLWYYYPSVPGNAAVAAIFLVLTLAHIIFLIKTRSKFCIPLVIGGIFEIIGYGCRVYAHYEVTTTLPYAAQSLLILLAPILFAASVYMYLGRIIVAVNGERQCIIPVRWLTKIFVTGDVVCFLVQGAGGGLLSGAKSASRVKLGENIILAGLVIQIVIFAFFIVVAGVFHFRMLFNVGARRTISFSWQKLLLGLYAVSILIAARNTVRAVEYGMGSDGYLLRHEWVTFIGDGAAMILVLAICLTWYYSAAHFRSTPVDVESTPLSSREPKMRMSAAY